MRDYKLPRKYLTLLLNSAKEFSSTLDLDTLLPRVLENTKNIVGCEAASVLLYDNTSNELYFDVALGDRTKSLKEIRVPLGKGIAGKSAEIRKSIVDNKVAKSVKHLKSIDKKTGFITKSIIATPLVFNKKLLGVIEVLNKCNKNSIFNKQDLRVIEALSSIIAICIQNVKTYQQAIIDPLTNLYNSGYFSNEASRILESTKKQCTFAIVDIDYFKIYNDNNGHLCGSEAIRQTAKIIKDIAEEKNCLCARYGGEEFGLVFYNISKKKSLDVLEKIRRSIESYPYPGRENQPLGKVTVSIGVSFSPKDGTKFEELMACADNKLYDGKKHGRNRISV